MTVEKRKRAEPVLSWILAMILCPLGISLSVKSGFGVSMIEAPVYVLHLKISEFFKWYSYGTSEYVLQAVLLILMCVIVRQFKWKYALSFVTAFIFGWILDGWNFLFGGMSADAIAVRILLAAIGCVVVSLAVSMFFRTWLPLEVWELFVKEVAEKYNFNMTKVKWIYDFSSLLLGIVLTLAFFGKFRWDAIGIGTIVTTFINAPMIGFFTKLQNKIWDSITD